MDEHGLKELITHVKTGHLSRRGFVQMMVGLGLTAPMAAQMLPSAGVAQAGKNIVWKLKKDVHWHDGKPFTADDVVFNWEYAADPATAAYCIATYKDIKVEKIDALSVRVTLAKPTPFWADAFVGVRGMIIPKHVFDPFKGGKSREAPANLKPVGTGPYRFVDFKPGDMGKAELNPN